MKGRNPRQAEKMLRPLHPANWLSNCFIIWQRPLSSGVPSDNLLASEGGCPEPRLLGVPLFNMMADASLKVSVSYFPGLRLPT
jgi:hypothetical protein